MTLLADLVRTSQRVGATAARLSKVRELASFLLALPPDEIETAAHYLSGEIPQGRIGIGYSTLQAAAASGAASAETLSLAEVDRSLALIAAIRGAGSSARRAHERPDRCRRGRGTHGAPGRGGVRVEDGRGAHTGTQGGR